MRVIVCGGRHYNDSQRVGEVLTRIDYEHGIEALIHGDAGGADNLARQWAWSYAVPHVIAYPADWLAHGLAAGPMRNQLMLDEGKPDLVVAFPGGGGTRDMVRRARKAGVRVIEIEATPTRRRA